MVGRGKTPVTWRTLIGCLEMTGFGELAEDLKKEMKDGDSDALKEESTGINLKKDSRSDDMKGGDSGIGASD